MREKICWKIHSGLISKHYNSFSFLFIIIQLIKELCRHFIIILVDYSWKRQWSLSRWSSTRTLWFLNTLTLFHNLENWNTEWINGKHWLSCNLGISHGHLLLCSYDAYWATIPHHQLDRAFKMITGFFLWFARNQCGICGHT